MRVLVTGIAGYIGSVVGERLLESGHEVVGIDNLQTGNRAAVPEDADFREGDILDERWLRETVAGSGAVAVVHLAAEASIDDSEPGKFFRTNVAGGLNLLDAMRSAKIDKIVFSSTAAVYGQPEALPIPEDAPKNPVNAYGESKLMFERTLAWYGRAYGVRHVSLRYFNACGATEERGEFRLKETHIIPLLIEVVLGKRTKFSLYGTDYPTPDGTCVRDYIHIADIADAHILALESIESRNGGAYNMGNGEGYSNQQVIETVRKVTGHALLYANADRRAGDPATLVASSAKIRDELGWTPRYPDLETMVATAWSWRRAHPGGY
ncbi:MAG: UDP-glucose 4-epimerase GalE [Armatimonadetes bacterium]|nr:UDP-glucose 4-epimerase GalE [Armatimonadota bacterium]